MGAAGNTAKNTAKNAASSGWKGYGYLIAWCVISAFSMILTGETNQSIHPVVVCFFSFLFATIFFLLINARRLGVIARKLTLPGQRRTAVWLNWTTFFSWVFLVYPLKYVEATAVITMVLGVNPVATMVINRLFFPAIAQKRANALVSLGILLSVFYVAWLEWRGAAGHGAAHQQEVMLSLACCAVAGIATAGNNVFIKAHFGAGFVPKEVLAFRFFLTILLTGVAIPLFHLPVALSPQFFIDMGMTTVFLLVAPLMLIQLSLRELDPMRVAIMSPIMPLVVALFQWRGSHAALSPYTVAGTVAIWLLVLTGIYVSRTPAAAPRR